MIISDSPCPQHIQTSAFGKGERMGKAFAFSYSEAFFLRMDEHYFLDFTQ